MTEYLEINDGDLFMRPRKFKPAEEGSLKWWMIGVQNPNDAPASGTEFIEIIETVPTNTMGQLVIYRQWLVDPDGAEVSTFDNIPKRKKKLFRSEVPLRQSLAVMGFRRARS